MYSKLDFYESVKEASTMIELALWRVKIEECCNDHRSKRPRLGHEGNHRAPFRINCGADIVLRNVLPYLLPVKLS